MFDDLNWGSGGSGTQDTATSMSGSPSDYFSNISDPAGLFKNLGGGNWMGQSHADFDPYAVDSSAFTDPNAVAERQQMLAAYQQYQQAQQQGTGALTTAQNALTQQVQGTGPSPADIQMGQGIDASNAAAMSVAASGQGGVNPALALRTALATQAANNQAGVGQTSLLRANETIGAANTLGTLGATQYGTASAGAQNTAQMTQAQSQQQVQNQQLLQALQAQNYNVAKSAQMQQAMANAGAQAKAVGGMMSGASSMATPLGGGGGSGAGAAGAAALSEGGEVRGPGGPKDDEVPVMASDGEFVMNAEAVEHFGPLLKMINDFGRAKSADEETQASLHELLSKLKAA